MILMNSASPEPGSPQELQYTPEQLAGINSLDQPSPAAATPAIPEPAIFVAIATGILVACVIWKFLDPDLARPITFVPGVIAMIYVGRHSRLGRSPFSQRASTLFGFLNGVLLGAGVWDLARLMFKHHLL
jgi:hypothetical protein